jgi:alkylated DNA repair dioxygenase AlkB
VGIDHRACWDRVALSEDSWVDVCRGYLLGADEVLDVLIDALPWRCDRRVIYDREVADPRLSYRCPRAAFLPHAVLALVEHDLVTRYRVRMGQPACNYYRDGRDSVAFHRDRELRDADRALVAVLTLGAERPFRLRPHGVRGVRSLDLSPTSGDLLVMGGACQRAWEHGVPKIARAGPRVSVTWRWKGSARASR